MQHTNVAVHTVAIQAQVSEKSAKRSYAIGLQLLPLHTKSTHDRSTTMTQCIKPLEQISERADGAAVFDGLLSRQA
jgi:hypothetical protein